MFAQDDDPFAATFKGSGGRGGDSSGSGTGGSGAPAKRSSGMFDLMGGSGGGDGGGLFDEPEEKVPFPFLQSFHPFLHPFHYSHYWS